ncbi:MAG: hypothetical protein IPN27_08755 [Cellvibrionales bacterium]|jgi:hypothetical protein|nr:hypothetical protein [Cellvibrionales bacterium]
MNTPKALTTTQRCLTLIACLFLFMGIGRIFSLVTHSPVLGYANNYDMIRLQACHQIWPADRFVNITTGTPTAPLRRYTLEKHVDTPCFPSSELLFTTIGIELGKLKNKVTGEELISIKTIGAVKALFLVITILLASLFFYRRAMYSTLLANALVTLLVLSDPGVTLYMNTFYTEFSAVYFLYLTLIGVVVLAKNHWRLIYSWILLIGLVGLSFSKPQHAPLAFCIAALLSLYALTKKQWAAAPLMLLCAALPFIAQQGGWYAPRNESMIRTDNINLVGSMLGISHSPEKILADLGLPAACNVLAGRNGYDAKLHNTHACPEVDTLQSTTVLFALTKNPSLTLSIVTRMLAQQKNWVFDMYGQVERGRNEPASHYQRTINSSLQQLPDNFFIIFPLITILLIFVLLIVGQLKNGAVKESHLLLLLLVIAQSVLMISVISQGGTISASKNMHLFLPILLCQTFLLFTTQANSLLGNNKK